MLFITIHESHKIYIHIALYIIDTALFYFYEFVAWFLVF